MGLKHAASWADVLGFTKSTSASLPGASSPLLPRESKHQGKHLLVEKNDV